MISLVPILLAVMCALFGVVAIERGRDVQGSLWIVSAILLLATAVTRVAS